MRGHVAFAFLAMFMVAPPLLAGGVHDPLALGFAFLAQCALFAAWSRQDAAPPAFWAYSTPFLIAGLACAVQLAPLPEAWLRVLSPEAVRIRAIAGAHGAAPLSVSPVATSFALVHTLGLWALFWTSFAVARSRRQARALLGLLVAMSAFEAVAALVQHGMGTKLILGVFSPNFREKVLVGTFVNSNHAAGFLALASAPALTLMLGDSLRTRFLAGSAALLALGALVMSGSRGGLVGCLAGVIATALLWRARGTSRRTVVFSAAAVLLATSALFASSGDAIVRRFRDEASLMRSEKMRAWHDAASITRSFPLTGVGRGAYEEVSPRFKSFESWLRVRYPENWPLQFSSEWGLPVTLLLVGSLLRALFKRSRPQSETHARALDSTSVAAAAGLVAIGTQNLFDFNLEFWGCGAPASILLGIFFATRERRPQPGPVTSAPLALAACGCIALATYLAFGMELSLSSIDERLPKLTLQEIETALAVHPADFRLHLERGRRRQAREPELAMLDFARAAYFDPRHPGPHHAQARLHYRRGSRALAALEYRLALELRPSRSLYEEVILRYGAELVRALPDRRESRLEALAVARALNRTESVVILEKEAKNRRD